MNKTARMQSTAKSPLVWIALLVGGAAIVTILLASRGDDAVEVRFETSSVQVSGPELPAYAQPDPAVGMQAPTVVASTLDGDRVELGAAGNPLVVGFFAHWCSHCQNEVPRAVQWMSAPDLPTGVEVVAVSTSVNPKADNYPPSAWFDRVRWPTPVLLDSEAGEIATQFGLPAFPYWVAINGDGEIVARASGEIGEEGFRYLLTVAAG
jgi:thiol-disulfide isomerase/thioredoxin